MRFQLPLKSRRTENKRKKRKSNAIETRNQEEKRETTSEAQVDSQGLPGGWPSFVSCLLFVSRRFAGRLMAFPVRVTSDMDTKGLRDDLEKQRRGDTWLPEWKPSDGEEGCSFKDVKVKRKLKHRSKRAPPSEGSMTDEEIDTGKNLVTQAEIIRMLEKEIADLKEQWKSMEDQLSRLTDAVMQSNARRDKEVATFPAEKGTSVPQLTLRATEWPLPVLQPCDLKDGAKGVCYTSQKHLCRRKRIGSHISTSFNQDDETEVLPDDGGRRARSPIFVRKEVRCGSVYFETL